MVKKKGGREMNPADAFRKTQRAKEIARNKKERKFQRDAHSLQADPDAIKEELKEVLQLEEDGKVNQTLRLKKRALQGAYDTAVKKKKEEELRKVQPDTYAFTNQSGHGVLERHPEESVYYHPTLNPSGLPPPGKPQRYKTAAPLALQAAIPVPKPPPLPAGPAPSHSAGPSGPLPPPAGPPPGHNFVLPPPAGPQPRLNGGNEEAGPSGMGVLPPPMGLPPGMPGGMLPPPMGPPPGFPGMMRPQYVMPPPTGPPPGMAAREAGEAKKEKDTRPTIQGASTVVKLARAPNDKALTSMVPASVRVRRDTAPAMRPRSTFLSTAPSAAPKVVGPDFGLAPMAAAPPPTLAPKHAMPRLVKAARGGIDKKYQDFLQEMEGLGALGA